MSEQHYVKERGRSPGHVLEHRPLITALAAAGIVVPIIFAVVALVHSLLRP